jgi:hypothetical protein
MILDTSTVPSSALTLSKYAVLVEQQDGFWVAQVLGWGECQAKADSRQAAIASLQTILSDRLTHGDVIYLDVPVTAPENPLMQYAGMFENDPQFEEVLGEIAAYRQELDLEREELQNAD